MFPSEHLDKFLRVDDIEVVLEIRRMREGDEVPYAGAIAERVGVDPSLLSKRLDEFEDSGLIERGERLGNLKLLRLTDEGEVVAEWLREVVDLARFEEEFDREISED